MEFITLNHEACGNCCSSLRILVQKGGKHWYAKDSNETLEGKPEKKFYLWRMGRDRCWTHNYSQGVLGALTGPQTQGHGVTETEALSE